MQTAEDRLKLADEGIGELLEELRNSYWVDFTEEDFVNATTVGELFDCVMHKVGPFESPRCLSSFAFFRMRRVIAEIAGVDRLSIRPATLLNSIVPAPLRPKLLEAVENRLRFRTPGLTIGRLGCWLCWTIAALIGAVCYSLYRQRDPLIVSAYALAAWGIGAVVARLPKEFGGETVGDLVRQVVVLNQGKLAKEAGGSTVGQAWWAFREMLAGPAGKEPFTIQREMRFPEDMGIY